MATPRSVLLSGALRCTPPVPDTLGVMPGAVCSQCHCLVVRQSERSLLWGWHPCFDEREKEEAPQMLSDDRN